MRTYGTRTVNAFDCKIWEAARATTAAITFFEPISINGVSYADGGTGWNNPTLRAIEEAGKIWPNRPFCCLLSVGTGLQKAVQLSDRSGKKSNSMKLFNKLAPKSTFKLDAATYCANALTDCEAIHHDACGRQSDGVVLDQTYFRWNVPHGLADVGLEEWNKIGDIKTITGAYMRLRELESRKIMVAQLLLNPRIAG
jgi:Patatin-like phospholipase